MGMEPFDTSTANVGLEGKFYGESGPGTLDDKITNIEPDFFELLKKLRKLEPIDPEMGEQCTRMIKHFWVRSGHLRHCLGSMMPRLYQGFYEVMESAESFGDYLQLDTVEGRENLEQMIIEQAQKNYPHASEGEIRQVLAERNVDYRQVLRENEEQLSQMRNLLSDRQKNSSEFVVNAHISALLKVGGQAEMADVLDSFEWEVVRSHDTSLILGDVGALTLCKGGDRELLPLYVRGGDSVSGVVLPISRQLALCGTDGQIESTLDFNDLNKSSMRWSVEFAISHPEDDFRHLHQILTKGWEEYLDELIRGEFPSQS